MHTKGIKVKMARKQFAGLELREHAREVVYAIRGALWVCQHDEGAADGRHAPPAEPDLASLAAKSVHECDPALPGVQTPVGEPQPIETSAEGCGSWMPPEYRVCAPSLKGGAAPPPPQPLTVLRRNGAFVAQGFAEAPAVVAEGGRCRQVAFFHMQEWKSMPPMHVCTCASLSWACHVCAGRLLPHAGVEEAVERRHRPGAHRARRRLRHLPAVAGRHPPPRTAVTGGPRSRAQAAHAEAAAARSAARAAWVAARALAPGGRAGRNRYPNKAGLYVLVQLYCMYGSTHSAVQWPGTRTACVPVDSRRE